MANRDNTARNPLSQETLKALLHYEPETGKLFWRERPLTDFPNRRLWSAWQSQCARKETFTSISVNGYKNGLIFQTRYHAHRVIMMMINGDLEGVYVDHINGNRGDNRLENLRLVTKAENAKNVRLPSTNKSGVIGVYWHNKRNKWHVQIRNNGRSVHLGYFTDFEEAVAARKAADERFGYHPNHGSIPQL